MSTDTINTGSEQQANQAEFRIPAGAEVAAESLHPELNPSSDTERAVSDARLAVSDAYAAQDMPANPEQQQPAEIQPADAARFIAVHGQYLKLLRTHHTSQN